MDTRGKSLAFSEAEIEDLLSMRYGDKRLFVLLSLLFPFVDLRNQFHIDHVFPASRFSVSRLRRVGMAEENIDRVAERANELPNLQLLEGTINIEKRAALLAVWLANRYANNQDREHYCLIHLLGVMPQDVRDCEAFWDARRERLRDKLAVILSI